MSWWFSGWLSEQAEGQDAIIPKGDIAVNTDFPLADQVQRGWMYRVIADVTDNAGAPYTNTGQSFKNGDEIYWLGSLWGIIGADPVWYYDGVSDIKKLTPANNVDLSGADVFTNNIKSATGNLGLQILDGGYVGIGTSTPAHQLHVDGNGYFLDSLGVGITPSAKLHVYKDNALLTDIARFKENSNDLNLIFDCGSGKVSKFDYKVSGSPKFSQTVTSTYMRFTNDVIQSIFELDSSGKVGIFSTTISERLTISDSGTVKANKDIVSITNFANAVDMDGTESSIRFDQYYYDASTPAAAPAARITVGTETDWLSPAIAQDSYMALHTALDGVVAEKFRITSTGYVGIGKIPTAKVDIVNDVPGINDPGFVMKSVSAIAGNSNTLRLDTTDVDDQNVIQFYKAGFVSWQFVGRNQIDIPNDRFSIFDNSTIEVFTILQGGNVGVGTDVPNKNLVVSSVDDTTLQIQRTDAVTVGDQTTLEFSHTADMLARIQSYLPGELDVDLRFYTTNNDVINTTPVMTLSGNNYVGIGTAAPEELLHVYQSTSYPIVKVQSGTNTARTGAIRFAQVNESAYEIGMDGSDSGPTGNSLYIQNYISGTPGTIDFVLQGFSDIAYFRSGMKIGIGTDVPVSTFEVNGSIGYKITEIDHTDSPYTVLANDYKISVDCSGGNVVINLPDGVGFWNGTDFVGRVITIIDKTASAGGTYNITVNADTSDSITTSTTDNSSVVLNNNGEVKSYQLVAADIWKES